LFIIFDSITVISIYKYKTLFFNFGRVVIPLKFIGLLNEIPIKSYLHSASMVGHAIQWLLFSWNSIVFYETL